MASQEMHIILEENGLISKWNKEIILYVFYRFYHHKIYKMKEEK